MLADVTLLPSGCSTGLCLQVLRDVLLVVFDDTVFQWTGKQIM